MFWLPQNTGAGAVRAVLPPRPWSSFKSFPVFGDSEFKRNISANIPSDSSLDIRSAHIILGKTLSNKGLPGFIPPTCFHIYFNVLKCYWARRAYGRVSWGKMWRTLMRSGLRAWLVTLSPGVRPGPCHIGDVWPGWRERMLGHCDWSPLAVTLCPLLPALRLSCHISCLALGSLSPLSPLSPLG